MAGAENSYKGKPKVTGRLIDMINEMSLEQQLELLNQLDRKQYHKGRSDQRHHRKIRVDYKIGKTVYHGFIHDISAAGVFVETGNAHKTGDEIILSFSLFEHKNPMKISGRIVRIEEDGFAVDFRLNEPARDT